MNNAIRELLQVAFNISKSLNLDEKFKDIKYSNKDEDELYKKHFELIIIESNKL